MKRLILLCLLFIFTVCALNAKSGIVDGKISGDYTYEMNKDYLILHVPNNNKVQLQLFNIDNLEMIHHFSFNQAKSSYGFYKNGYYVVSLNKNKITFYQDNGQIKHIKVNDFFNRESWNQAFMNYEGDILYYVKGHDMYAYHLQDKNSEKIYTVENELSLFLNNKYGLYLVDSSTNVILKINEGHIETLEDVHYMDDYYIVENREGKTITIYDQTTERYTSFDLRHSDEEVVASNFHGVLTSYENSLYYYHLTKGYVYRIDIDVYEDVEINDENMIFVVNQEKQIHSYSLDDASKVHVILNMDRATRGTSKIIDAPIIPQLPDYPSGCESVSAVMLLRYLGEDITVDTFIDEYLDQGTIESDEINIYAPNPYVAYAGDPRSTAAWGCMAPVIEEAIAQYYGNGKYVENTTGLTLEALCHNYIDRDYPVVVWASLNMAELYKSQSWITPEGETYTWLANEHCLLLVGYDQHYYYFNDPWTGERQAYRRNVVENRYKTLGMQSLTIISDK